MALTVPIVGRTKMMDLLKGAFGTTLRFKLYQNNYTPDANSIISSFTEATFDGYTFLNETVWNASALDGSNRGVSQGGTLTWTKSAGATGNNIYGYFVTDASGNLLWAERGPAAPYPMTTVGQTFQLGPQFSFTTEF